MSPYPFIPYFLRSVLPSFLRPASAQMRGRLLACPFPGWRSVERRCNSEHEVGLLANGLGMEIKSTDKNGPVRFDLPRQIFLAREVLDRFSVRPEHLQLVLAVASKFIIKRFAADFASHACVDVLAPKNHDSTVKNPLLVRFGKFQFMTSGRLVGVV